MFLAIRELSNGSKILFPVTIPKADLQYKRVPKSSQYFACYSFAMYAFFISKACNRQDQLVPSEQSLQERYGNKKNPPVHGSICFPYLEK